MRKLANPMKPVKIPPPLPVWIVKAQWAGTAVKLLIPAKDEVAAKNKAWMKVARTMGGDLCVGVKVLGQQVKQEGTVN